METLVRAVGALSCLMIVLGVAMAVAGRFAPEDERKASGELAGVKDMPALALEFVRDASEVERFLGARDAEGDSAMRRKIRRALAWDNVFIAAYWLLFAGLCALLAQRDFTPGAAGLRWWNPALCLAVFAALCATGAAVSDTVENARTVTLLDAAAVTGPLLRGVAAASFQKWLLISLATLALSPIFLWGGGRRALFAGGGLFLLYVLIGVLTLWGILGGRPRLVMTGFLLNFVGVIVVAVLFSLWPRRVASRL
jgi:hypothetical protein